MNWELENATQTFKLAPLLCCCEGQIPSDFPHHKKGLEVFLLKW